MKRSILAGMVFLFSSVTVAQAGWLDNAIEGATRRLGNRAVNEAGDTAYDAAKGSAKGAIKGEKASARKDRSSREYDSDQARGNKRVARGDDPAPSGENLYIEEAETVFTKFDFIPGDKTIFFDDFSDTDVGEFPRKWTFEGPKQGKNNSVDVVEFQGKHFLRSVPGPKGQPPATQYLRLDQKGDFPEKFTVEFDAVLAAIKDSPVYHVYYKLLLVPADKNVDIFRASAPGAILISGRKSESVNTSTTVDLNDGRVHHVAISVNGTFVKAYIDAQRVVNDPDGVKRPIKQIGLQMSTPNNFRSDKLLFTNFRVAEGGKNIKSALDTEGKIVTHGILFDTGKSVLKPESLPTLKMILGLMTQDPDLKFSIEGHTDNQGGKGINGPLSERRAAAVAEWLKAKGIETDRLKTAGFGDTKPMDNNKTLEGRANNRRVEFVKF